MTQGKSQVRVLGDSGQARMTFHGLLSIREFAQVCRTTPRTLRFYEQKGLFKPAKIDTWNKYRFYNPKQARDFLKIKLLQNFHVPLKDILTYSVSENSSQLTSFARTMKPYTAEEYLQNKLKAVKEEIKEKEKEYKFLEKINDFLFQTDSGRGHTSLVRMTLKNIFQTQTFGPLNLFCMKVEHGKYARITEYIKTLWKEAKRLKLQCEPSEITFYLDNAYNPKNAPLEIVLILRAKGVRREVNNLTMKQLSNDFHFKSYPKTKVLSYKYIGPYEYLILVYQKLFSNIEEQKMKLSGLVFETYKYGPLNTKSKYDYETTIGFPI